MCVVSKGAHYMFVTGDMAMAAWVGREGGQGEGGDGGSCSLAPGSEKVV